MVLFVPEGGMDLLDQLVPEAAALVKMKASRLKFTGKEDSILAVELERGPVGSVYLAGLGGGDGPLPLDRWRRGMALAVRQAGKDRRVKMMALSGEAATPEVVAALAEGALLAEYAFEKYKTQVEPVEKPEPLEELLVHGADAASLEKGSLRAAAQNYARDLANEPGNVISPAALAGKALAMAEEWGLDCEVLDETRMREMGDERDPQRRVRLPQPPEAGTPRLPPRRGFEGSGSLRRQGDHLRQRGSQHQARGLHEEHEGR
jgi:leucyl aminopeptidase